MLRIVTLAALSAILCFSLAASGQETAKKVKKDKAKEKIAKKDKAEADIPLAALAEKRAKAIKSLSDFAKSEEANQIGLIRKHLAGEEVGWYERRMLIAQHNKLMAAYNAELPKRNSSVTKTADAYNKQGVAEYNRLVEKHNQEVADYNRVIEKYNKAIRGPSKSQSKPQPPQVSRASDGPR
jgi:hypothetical protein